jgi:hypothetical protein
MDKKRNTVVYGYCAMTNPGDDGGMKKQVVVTGVTSPDTRLGPVLILLY